MDETIDVMLQANERAEARKLRDLALHEIANLVVLVDVGPGIFAELFETERDALISLVDFEDDRFDIITFSRPRKDD